MKVLNRGKFPGAKKGTVKKSDTTKPTGFVPFEKKVPGKPAVK